MIEHLPDAHEPPYSASIAEKENKQDKTKINKQVKSIKTFNLLKSIPMNPGLQFFTMLPHVIQSCTVAMVTTFCNYELKAFNNP